LLEIQASNLPKIERSISTLSTINILNSTGHTEVKFDPAAVAAGDVAAQAAVAEAQRVIDQARAEGKGVCVKTPEGFANLDTLDPTKDLEIVIIPRMAGGAE
jgi:hypothetical protein